MDENIIRLIKSLIDEKILSIEDEAYYRKVLEAYKIQQLKVIECIDTILKEL